MPRRLRFSSGSFVFHALNRAVGRATLFDKDGDYAAFVKVLQQAHDETLTRLLAFCLMPNHFHLVVWPAQDGQLSRYLHWLTMTHTQRWHAHHHTTGTGPLYQGRFKSFPVRAGRVQRAEQWRWSSLGYRVRGSQPGWLHEGPLPIPDGWLEYVNAPGTEAELEALRRSVARGMPFGDLAWQQRAAERLGLQSTLRPRGRPRRDPPPPAV